MSKFIIAVLLIGSIVAGCTSASVDAGSDAGPVIGSITTSTRSFSIDCAPTTVTVSAYITDAAGIAAAELWYRVGSDRDYVSVQMVSSNGSDYQAMVKGSALPPDRYGALEFYVAAQDKNGHSARSSVNTSVQFLPCISH